MRAFPSVVWFPFVYMFTYSPTSFIKTRQLYLQPARPDVHGPRACATVDSYSRPLEFESNRSQRLPRKQLSEPAHRDPSSKTTGAPFSWKRWRWRNLGSEAPDRYARAVRALMRVHIIISAVCWRLPNDNLADDLIRVFHREWHLVEKYM